jgi:hypothetical protein
MKRVKESKDPVTRKALQREKYAANKDRRCAQQRARYQRNIERERMLSRERRAREIEKFRERGRKYRLANLEKDRAWQRESRERRSDRVAEYNKRYKQENRGLYASAQKVRQTLQLRAMPKWVDRAALDAFYAEASRLSIETGIRHSVDHIYPLKGKNCCGLHVPWNLQILTLRENIQKSNRSPDEWRPQSEQETICSAPGWPAVPQNVASG